MKCIFCDYPQTRVVDSRVTEGKDSIKRRRECIKCAQRFTTYERVEDIPLSVIKKDGTRELFDRSKLLAGLLRATVKRRVPTEALEKMLSDIELQLRNEFKYEIRSKDLGEMVLERLKELDRVAYVRFASVYRDFQDIDQFLSELNRLK
ncbi:MAG: transcriptional regulator NrdR [Actinomycetota bacterium]|nr:transcriptional regulator NrdR [Actinomycetota bacterium]